MFCRPKAGSATRHLFVGNCGPAVGLTESQVQHYFESTGAEAVTIPVPAAGSSSHVFVTYKSIAEAKVVLEALSAKPPAELGNRKLVVKYADVKADQQADKVTTRHVNRDAALCNIPGLELHQDFISSAEEQDLLQEVRAGPWETLARRRVQHFGFKFEYVSRNVDIQRPIEPLPPLARQIACRLEELLGTKCDQLTVNEYEPGVGLSAHVDTHSAFTGPIVSLSLAGPCVMEFRRGGEQRALFLPPRSLLVMADEARYAWHHYIPHRRSDPLDGEAVPRAASRVSFTFRKVRGYPCVCKWPGSCDSQGGGMPPTRMALAAQDNSPGTASSCSGVEPCADQKAPDSLAPANELQQACSDSDLPISVGKSFSQRRLEASSLADNSQNVEQQHTQARSSASANDGQSKEHCEQDSAVFHALSHEQRLDISEDQPMHGSSAGIQQGDSQSSAAGQQMESRYVHGVYDIIAGHFSATRFAIWPKVREFIDSLPPSGVVADVGCGNGKYFGVRADLAVLGSDRSPNLAETAAKRLQPSYGNRQPLPRCDVAVADGLHLPYRSGALDGVLCIAVLHHISTVERRIAMLAELARVLRCGGRAIVTVWASEQEQPGKLAKWEPIGPGSRSGGGDYFVPWHVPFHRVEAAAAASKVRTGEASHHQSSALVAMPHAPSASHQPAAGTDVAGGISAAPLAKAERMEGKQAEQEGSEQFSRGLNEAAQEHGGSSPCTESGVASSRPDVSKSFLDGRVDEAKRTVVFKRYYHLYDKGELEGLVEQVPNVKLVSSFFDKSNWCAMFEKV